MIGREIEDKTPEGILELKKRAVQFPQDITRRTTSRTVLGILRGVIADHLDRRRIGVICHRVHQPAIDDLEPLFRQRIARVAYFGSGEERASNAWYRECDLIVVLGTPRVPPSAIRAYLVQVDELAAAAEEGAWGPLTWRGWTESGAEWVIASRGYTHPAWQRAYREIVRANLIQAIGRGRGVLEEGIDVVVVSTDECGLRLADANFIQPVTETDAHILEAVGDLTLLSPKIYIIGDRSVAPGICDRQRSVTTDELSRHLHLSPVQIRKRAALLERRGLLLRHGQRGGWLPAPEFHRSTGIRDGPERMNVWQGKASLDELCRN